MYALKLSSSSAIYSGSKFTNLSFIISFENMSPINSIELLKKNSFDVI